MADREPKNQKSQNLYDSYVIKQKESLTNLLKEQPYYAAFFLVNKEFLKNDKPVYADIDLETSGGTKKFKFEVFPVGGFLQYINSFYVSDEGKLTIYFKEGFTSQSKMQLSNSLEISGSYDGFSAKLGVSSTVETTKNGSREVEVTIAYKFNEGNYFCYQTAAVCAYKLDSQFKSQAPDILSLNKDDYDMRMVNGDLYFFVAKHRNDMQVTPTDNEYRAITQKEFVDYLTDESDAGSIETWNIVTAR